MNPDLFGEGAARQIRVKGLSAFYLPDLRRPGVPHPGNSVNTLRFVFNQYLGTHFEMLRSASYLEGDAPFEYKEIRVRCLTQSSAQHLGRADATQQRGRHEPRSAIHGEVRVRWRKTFATG